jgi:hypothetical protein
MEIFIQVDEEGVVCEFAMGTRGGTHSISANTFIDPMSVWDAVCEAINNVGMNTLGSKDDKTVNIREYCARSTHVDRGKAGGQTQTTEEKCPCEQCSD